MASCPEADALVAAVDRARGVDLDELADVQVRDVQRQVQTAIRRLQAWQSRLAGVLTDRARAAARAEKPDDPRAPERAARGVREDMVDDLRLSPSQAKQVAADDRRLRDLPEARNAFEEGEISSDHVRSLDRTLKVLGPEDRARLEPVLVAAGRREDPVTFGRTCRRALADFEPEEAVADLDRQHDQRSARAAQRPDGMTHLSADVAGVDGAFLHATLDAFRRQDARGEHRRAEQRTADAFMEMVRAAAGTIDDPNARHGLPVFLLQLPAEELLSDDEIRRLRRGSGTETFTGPLPVAELERLIGDAHVAGLLADANGLPLAVTEQKRSVPLGLWRLLVARDGGCIVEGCDAPAGSCQVAHLGDWYTDGGKLAPDTSGLLCPRHHRPFDRGRLVVTWSEGRPAVHYPERGPAGGANGTGRGDRNGTRSRWGGRYGRTQFVDGPEALGVESAGRPAAEPLRGAKHGQADGGEDPPGEPPPDPPRLPGVAREARATYRARAPGGARERANRPRAPGGAATTCWNHGQVRTGVLKV